MTPTRQTASITALLLISFLLLTLRLNAQWTGHHDENGAWISAAVRNYDLYGAAELAYLPVVNRGPVGEAGYNYYLHHPPLIVWSVEALTLLFGRGENSQPHEMSARLASVYATMISIAAFFVVARRLFGPDRALWTTALYVFTPMMFYFGRMPNHEPLALGFILPFVAIYLNWLQSPTRARWLGMALMAGLAMWTAWASAFLFAGLGLTAMIIGDSRHRRQMIALGLLTGLVTLAIPAFYELQVEGAIERMREAFSFRTSSQQFSRGSEDFNAIQFVARQLDQMLRLISFYVLPMGAAGAFLLWRRGSQRQKAAVFGLLLGAMGYMLVFRNAHYIHDYYKIYWLAPLALAASVATTEAFKIRRRRPGKYLRPLAISLLLSSLIVSGVFFFLLHASGLNTLTPDLVALMQTETREDDFIGTNLEFQNSAVEYYAFREIEWELSPEDFEAVASTQPNRAVYLHCPVGEPGELTPRLQNAPRIDALRVCDLFILSQ